MNPRYFDPEFGAIISRGLGKGIGLGFGLGLGKSLFKGFEALWSYYAPELENEIQAEEATEGFCHICQQSRISNLYGSTPSEQRLMREILYFFSYKPNPTGDELRNLARRLGLSPLQFKELAYMTILKLRPVHHLEFGEN